MCSDPGVIPRSLAKNKQNVTNPNVKQITVSRFTYGTDLIRLKYCVTCNIYRPFRTSHCDDCGCCIERFDHHCVYIGICIGKKNHLFFYCYLLSTLLLFFSIAGVSGFLVYRLFSEQEYVLTVNIILTLIVAIISVIAISVI